MLRLLTYLAPGLPLGLYEAIGDYLAARLDVDVELASDPSRSGPGPGSDDPFADGRADVGFVCGPSYSWMAHQGSVDLVRAAPVHDDPRNGGGPVYFSELVVHRDAAYGSLADLEGARAVFNDPSSLSGYHCLLDALAARELTSDFFGSFEASGSHHHSLAQIADGRADVAAIDANVLTLARRDGLALPIRSIQTLGPFPVQPVVARRGLREAPAIAEALLEMHHASGGEPLRRYGVLRFAPVEPEEYEALHEATRLPSQEDAPPP
ncbi:MAG: PhnD/SsuA/transferrin family substrate-binding protein [Myxococcales bacterium]|nr:PhnD/SsuA/transferrin family substrate-binding protein [Myxococcales bacterium]